MSLVPMLFSDWWEDLDRPHHLWDQFFGSAIDPDDLFYEMDAFTPDFMFHRPHRRVRRRYHPFSKSLVRKGRGASTVQAHKDKFQVTLDVSQFAPEEVNVKVSDHNIVVEAKHEEKEDSEGCWVSRHFSRKYIVPSQCDIDQVQSHLSSDGILSITAPRKEPLKPESNERAVKIQYTGKPALTNHEETANDVDSQKNQQPQRGQQQQQPQQQQRGRKSAKST